MDSRYDYVYEKAAEFLEDVHEQITLPLNLEKIITSKGWELNEYCCFDDQHYTKSSEGYSNYENDNFSIFINASQPDSRKLFTLGHELGHIILNHHLEFKKELLSHNNRVMGALEREANCFARLIIAPAEIITHLSHVTPYLIHKLFGVSREEAHIRFEWVDKDIKRSKFTKSHIIQKAIKEANSKVKIIIDEVNQKRANGQIIEF